MNIFNRVLTSQNLHTMETLALAHVGDAVYDLAVRGYLAEKPVLTARVLHRETVRRVSAHAQAARTEALLPLLTDEERGVYLRGRNAQVNTLPKAATREEYGMATGVETLVGWLFLSGAHARLGELFEVLLHEPETHAAK